MAHNVLSPVWNRITRWFSAEAEQVTVRFIEDPGGTPIYANTGYLRVFLSQGFLARARNWGNEYFPVLHGGAAVSFLGATTPFTTFARPTGSWTTPGAQLDFPLTPLLPFNGGLVEIEAALYEASTGGPLITAAQIVGGLSSLLTPPLSVAAAVVGKLGDSVDKVIGTEQPVLGLHYTMAAPGGGMNDLRSGSLVVINTPESALHGPLSVGSGGLLLDNGNGAQPLNGVDYLVVRVECRSERPDWRFPELDELIRRAGEAIIRGYTDQYEDLRTDAVARAWNSPDLIPSDRLRVATLVRREIDAARDLRAVPTADRSLELIAEQELPSPDDPELSGLTLRALLERS
jgi:hypothetical protein